MENTENTEVIRPEISHIPSNKPVAFSFTDFFDRNKKLVIYSGVALVVLIVGVIGYRYYQTGQEEKGKDAIFGAQRFFENDSFNLALKGSGGVPGLVDVAEEYSGTKVGQQAHYDIGMIKLQQGKYQEAIDNLEDFKLKDAIVYPLALGGIGDAYSQLKDYDKAISYYLKAAKANDNQFTTTRFYKKAAIVYEKQGDYKAALDLYNTLKEKYKNTPQTIDIEKNIARDEAAASAK